ncbi:MAG: hypothetical protein ABR566_18810 [Pyrinomonadaceae bacterium]
MTKIIRTISAYFILFVITSVAVSAQNLSAEEQKIVSYIDANSDAAISFLEKTVNIESPTENLVA